MVNKSNILKETRVNRYSTCLSYALDRVGLSEAYKFISEIPDNKYQNFNTGYVKVGDIVAWKNRSPSKFFNTSIMNVDGYPVLVQHIEDTKYHFGVVERITSDRKIIISDCTRSLNPNYFPEIRLRLFSLDNVHENEYRLPEFIVNI